MSMQNSNTTVLATKTCTMYLGQSLAGWDFRLYLGLSLAG